MAAAFGVHFGSTSACLAVCRDGKSDVVANEAGDRVTPAVVAFTDRDLTVGLPAKQGIIRNASNTVCQVKQLIGRSGDDPEVEKIINSSAVKINTKGKQPSYEVDYKEKTCLFSPVEVASHTYKNMLRIAEHHVGSSESHDAVITVPVHFGEERKESISEAAKKAGFNVLRVISEPSAAVLAYDIGQGRQTESCKVLVYRLGGVSLDVTVMAVNCGMYQLLSSVTTQETAGFHITELLVNHFASEFKRQWKCDCLENKRSVMKLRNAAETCKHILSKLQTAQSSVDSLYEGIDFQCAISRARYDGLCGSLIQSCMKPVTEALTKAALLATDIQKVIVCGGSAQIPSIQKQLESYFPNAEILRSISPDEVIALGAAKQAAILLGHNVEEIEGNAKEVEVPCLSTDILVEMLGEDGAEHLTILPKTTPVPARQVQNFTLDDEQTTFSLHVLTKAGDGSVHSLAKINMKDLPAGCQINTVFHLRGDGALHITCKEPTSEKSQDVLIEAS